MTPLEGLASGSSLLHGLDPRLKLAFALAFITGLSVTPSPPPSFLGLHLIFLMTLIPLGDLPLAHLLKRLALLLPFALLTGALLPFWGPGTPLWSASLGPFEITLLREGTIRFCHIIAKATLSASCLLLLAATTPTPHILWGLSALGLPRLMVTLMGFVLRYLGLILERLRTMHQSALSRGLDQRRRRLGVYGAMTGSLFLDCHGRAERIHLAMLSRGFDGSFHPSRPARWSPLDTQSATLAIFILAVAHLGRIL